MDEAGSETVVPPPVGEREYRRAERLTWLLCALGGAVLALVHMAITAVLAPNGPAALFFPGLAGYGLACLAWAMHTGRLLGPNGDPRDVAMRRTFELYRGSIVILPAVTIAMIGGLVDGHWRAGGVVLMVGGLALMVAGFAVGTLGRPMWLMPRPMREGWPEAGTGPMPHLYPGYVAHVVALRRLRSRLFGGDPNAPLGDRADRPDRPSWLS